MIDLAEYTMDKSWYNIDFEDIIQLRENFIEQQDRVTNLSSAVLDLNGLTK